MQRARRSSLRFLLNPDDPDTRTAIAQTVKELRSFDGNSVQEMMDGLEGINRSEASEQRRVLRMELAGHVAETSIPDLPMEPSEARRALFAAVWNRGFGFVTGGEDLFQASPEEFYAEAARQLSVEPAALKECLFADIPEVRRVIIPPDLESTPPAVIVSSVNCSRMKQKLRRAVSVRLSVRRMVEGNSPYTTILWSLKRNGLMYEVGAESAAGGLLLFIRGPGALIEKTTIYGNRLALFVIDVLRHGSFDALAIELLAPRRTTSQGALDVIHLTPDMHRFFAAGTDPGGGEVFKSDDEAAFRKYFAHASAAWTLHYEGTIIPLQHADGKPAGFIVPDFVARNTVDGRTALIEIVGFWRKEYLRRKIEKVSLVHDQQLFLIVNGTLKLDRADVQHLENLDNTTVLQYRGRKELKRAAEEVVNRLQHPATGK